MGITLRDAWLLPTLEALLSPDVLVRVTAAVEESYWDAARREGGLSDRAILEALAARNRLPIAELGSLDLEQRGNLPESLARKYGVVPLRANEEMLEVATSDPTDLDCERALEFATGRSVRFTLASPSQIADALDELYRPENMIEKILENVSEKYDVHAVAVKEEIADVALLGERAGERPVIRLVDHIVAEAISSRASDIHLEPEEQKIAVRYRIDGVLRETMELPRAAGGALVSRVKIMSGLDIADRLRPQDGRSRVTVNGKAVDLRISTLPAAHGEKVVIRILDQNSTALGLDKLGLDPADAERLEGLLAVREGVILVTGPTGSGKTTSLYSALGRIKERDVNIVTVEDPVEYRLPGVVQVQVNEKAGLTFASALRSILRQDPDVVLVGEIRDGETAGIAVQASLTGHLVLSTLHTIDAASSVARLVDIGVEPYKIAAALKGVVAQRLVRRLCTACRTIDEAALSERQQRWLPPGATRWKAVGCQECGGTGYRGRAAIMEILVTDHALERCIASGGAADEVTEAARENGMRTLWEAGVAQVVAGVTSVDELVRVAEPPSVNAVARSRRVSKSRRNGRRVHKRALAEPPTPAADSVPSATVTTTAMFASEAFQLLDEAGIAGEKKAAGKHSVLLVHSDDDVRAVLRDQFEADGVHVVEATSGAVALDLIDREAPELVILGSGGSGLDAIDVLQRVRARPDPRDLAVVVLSGQDEESEVRAFAAGATDVVATPDRYRALGARVRAHLDRARVDRRDAVAVDDELDDELEDGAAA